MHDTMLTYSQWERRFKRALKKTIRKKLANVMWGILTISVFMLPFWMGHGLVVTRMLIDRKEP